MFLSFGDMYPSWEYGGVLQRLLRTNLTEDDVGPVKEQLAQVPPPPAPLVYTHIYTNMCMTG